jgi:hypothetical protein
VVKLDSCVGGWKTNFWFLKVAVCIFWLKNKLSFLFCMSAFSFLYPFCTRKCNRMSDRWVWSGLSLLKQNQNAILQDIWRNNLLCLKGCPTQFYGGSAVHLVGKKPLIAMWWERVCHTLSLRVLCIITYWKLCIVNAMQCKLSINDLIRRGSLEDASSSHVCRLVVCCVVMYYILVSSTTCFDLVRSSGRSYM